MPDETGAHASEPLVQVMPGREKPRRAISRAAVVAAALAGANILFLLLTDSGRSWGTYAERTVPLIGLIILAFGITALFCVGGTRFRVSGALMATAAILVGGFSFLVIPATCRVRESAKRAACTGNLKQIGIGLHLYADENDNAFPASLAQIFPAYCDTPKVFSCPSEPVSLKDYQPGDKITEKNCSYAYIPGLSASMPGPFIVACDKTIKNHQKEGREGGRKVLFLDTSVEWWPASREAEFQRRLALQSEAVAKWRASGKRAEAIDGFISPELRAAFMAR